MRDDSVLLPLTVNGSTWDRFPFVEGAVAKPGEDRMVVVVEGTR